MNYFKSYQLATEAKSATSLLSIIVSSEVSLYIKFLLRIPLSCSNQIGKNAFVLNQRVRLSIFLRISSSILSEIKILATITGRKA